MFLFQVLEEGRKELLIISSSTQKEGTRECHSRLLKSELLPCRNSWPMLSSQAYTSPHSDKSRTNWSLNIQRVKNQHLTYMFQLPNPTDTDQNVTYICYIKALWKECLCWHLPCVHYQRELQLSRLRTIISERCLTALQGKSKIWLCRESCPDNAPWHLWRRKHGLNPSRGWVS